MRWIDVVAAYPNQWLVVEAVEVHVEVVDPPELARGSSPDLLAEMDAIPEPVAHHAVGFDPSREDEPSDGTIADPIRDPIQATAAVPANGWTFRRVLDRVRVLELCADGRAAMHASREHARCESSREVLCVHTSYPSLHFDERVMARPSSTEELTPRRRRAPTERQRASR